MFRCECPNGYFKNSEANCIFYTTETIEALDLITLQAKTTASEIINDALLIQTVSNQTALEILVFKIII